MLNSRYNGPQLNTAESVALQLDVPLESLASFATDADAFYKPERREPKGNGKFRIINEPLPPLKEIQSRIVRACFHPVEFAKHLSGGISKRSYLQSVRLHSAGKAVITEDIQDFFPSISKKTVKKIWRDFFGFPAEVAELLSGLTTCKGFLPQGAPTSTYLANLVFFDCEPEMVEKLTRLGLKYSRHVDDMNVSSGEKIDAKLQLLIRELIGSMLATRQCRLNERKRRIQDRSMPCRVHGLLVNAGRPTKGKKAIANIRAAVKELESRVTSSSADQGQVETLFRKASGRVAELNQIQPTKARPLQSRLSQVKTTASQRWPLFCA